VLDFIHGVRSIPLAAARDKLVVVKCGKRDCVLLVDVRRHVRPQQARN